MHGLIISPFVNIYGFSAVY